MKKTALLLIIIITAAFINCDNTNDNKIEKIKDISFHVNPDRYRIAGVIDEEGESEKKMYFGDIVTDKCIKIFDLHGNILDSISLQKALKKLGSIENFTTSSKDSILVHSSYTNQIAIIDSDGNCWHHIDLHNKLYDDKGHYYEIHMPKLCKGNKSVFFNIGWGMEKSKNVEVPDNITELEYYYKKLYNDIPCFLKINNVYKENFYLEFGGSDIFENITDSFDSKLFADYPFYNVVNGRLLNASLYSDKLFVMDTSSLTVSKTVKIESEYTRIGGDFIKIEEISKKFQQLTDKYGYIRKILYNEHVNKYVLVIRIENNRTPKNNMETEANPFSVMILDQDFNKLGEYVFDQYEYLAYTTELINEGLLIKQHNQNKDETVYTLFDVPELHADNQ
ncbi:MAG: hypothetical protein ACOCVX_02360 [Bacteroidales bacterium]